MAYHRILVAPRAFGKGVQKEKLYSLITPTHLSIPSFPLENAAKTILDEWIELHLCTLSNTLQYNKKKESKH